MSKLHSYPWYTADWRGSEARLMSCEARGIYRELLDHHYDQGSLPICEQKLRKIASADAKEWKRSWPEVKVHFFERDGRLYNNKVLGRLPDLQRLAAERRDKALKASKARWEVPEDAASNAPSIDQNHSREMLKPCLDTDIGIGIKNKNGGEDSRDSDTDPAPPRRTPPPSKPKIETRPAAAGMSRPGLLQMPQREHTETEKAIGETLLAFTKGQLGEPLADRKLVEEVGGELGRAGMTPTDLVEILKAKRSAVAAANGWGLIVEIIRAACRGKPLKPRTNEFGRVLYPGDEGYAEAAH